jgi:hypothetical protein
MNVVVESYSCVDRKELEEHKLHLWIGKVIASAGVVE